MASINKVILIGNLGRDPELRSTSGGQAVCEFSLATSEKYRDRDGQGQERTEWHRIVVWGPQAESAAKYLTKGRTVYIEGRLQYRDWTDKEGNKRTTTEIVANTLQFLGDNRRGAGERDGGGPGNHGGNHEPPPANRNQNPGGGSDFGDDEIPF